MRLTEVGLSHFRNYTAETIAFEPGITLFYGQNAQGKTNILESIFLCTCARSHRTGKDAELIQAGHDAYTVQIAFATDRDEEETLRLHYEQKKLKRTIHHNDLQLTRVADLMGVFHAVIFAPEDLAIVKDGPAERRRFLDLLISQARPAYFRELSAYHHVLDQRNKLLKLLRDKSEVNELDILQLDVWDERLADAGAYLMLTRQDFAERLQKKATEALHLITNGKESLSLRYRSFGAKAEDHASIKGQYEKRLKTTRQDDIMRGITSIGPHRDDLEILLDGLDVRSYASQGQQRSITLALRIAELKILHEVTGEKPVLLLDDVMSELDVGRRTELLNAISGYQVLITCTDLYQVFSAPLAQAIYEDADDLASIKAKANDKLGQLGALHFYQVNDGQVHFKRTLD